LNARPVHGLAQMVRALSAQHTPMAWLSRAEVVQLGNMLVFALPGSPKAAAQCLDILAPVLGHALAMVEGVATDDCLQRSLAAPAGRGHAAAGRAPAAA
jgi:molybdopterin biosynthesis enzyme MoaB